MRFGLMGEIGGNNCVLGGRMHLDIWRPVYIWDCLIFSSAGTGWHS